MNLKLRYFCTNQIFELDTFEQIFLGLRGVSHITGPGVAAVRARDGLRDPGGGRDRQRHPQAQRHRHHHRHTAGRE